MSTFTAAQFSGTKKENFLVCKPAPILSNSIFETNEHNLLLFLRGEQRKGDI